MQNDLVAARVDGWLFYDFRGRDPIAQRILKLPEAMRTRRWFYFVPAKGTPRKLVHKIEAQALESLPGETLYYAGLKELEKGLKKLWAAPKRSDAIFAKKCDSLYVHGGCRNHRNGAGRRHESRQFCRPRSKI